MRKVMLWGLAISAFVAGVLSTVASSRPDGLEHVAETLGFGRAATEHAAANSPVADYAVRGLGEGALASGAAGLVGVAVVAGLAFVLMRVLTPAKAPQSVVRHEPPQDQPSHSTTTAP